MSPVHTTDTKQATATVKSSRDRTIAMVLAVLTGGIGGHQLYLGQYKQAALFILFVILSSGMALALLYPVAWTQALAYFRMSEPIFHQRVMKHRGETLPTDSGRSDEQLLVEQEGVYDRGGISRSLGGATKAQLFITNHELILGAKGTVPGGNVSRTIANILYGGAVRGLGRAIPFLGLAISIVVGIVRWFVSSSVAFTVDEARAASTSVRIPLSTIDSVAVDEVRTNEYHVQVTSTELEEPIVIALGSSMSDIGEEPLAQEFASALRQARSDNLSADSKEVVCPVCETDNTETAQYCSGCGNELASGRETEV